MRNYRLRKKDLYQGKTVTTGYVERRSGRKRRSGPRKAYNGNVLLLKRYQQFRLIILKLNKDTKYFQIVQSLHSDFEKLFYSLEKNGNGISKRLET